MHVRVVMFGLLLGLAAFAAAQGAQTRVTVHADLDRDGRADAVVVDGEDLAKGFERLTFDLSASGRSELAGDWTACEHAAFGRTNLLPLKAPFAASFGGAGTLLILCSPFDGDTPGPFAIYSVTRRGIQKSFSRQAFEPASIRRCGDTWCLHGFAELREAFASDEMPDAALATYAPELVYRLGTTIAFDRVRTEAINRRDIGGYAGSSSRSDVVIVRPARGLPYLMTWPGKQRL